ncbi:MAG: hypothetical protein QNJ68_23025 [Microcoleaceae cyanobacterium MO_207.B10]|nr:hypothetical protein [Microcoleaceae cyanobacterium MO_207.B10]
MLHRTLLTTSGFVIALSIINSAKAIAQNKVFDTHVVKLYKDKFIDSKVPSFSQNVSFYQLENLKNNTVDSSGSNNFVKADVFESASTTLSQLYRTPELNKPSKEYYHSLCKNLLPTNDGSCQQEVLNLSRKLEDSATVSSIERVDPYIEPNYQFTAFFKTAVVNSSTFVLFEDLTEDKTSTVVFSNSSISEPEITNPVTNAASLGSQIVAQEEIVESDVTENEPEERAWKFELTPFAFVPLNVDGDSTVEGVTADINMDLGEILEILTFAASGRFEAWYKNKFGIIFEGIYLKLGDDGEDIISGPRGLVDLQIEVDVEYDQAVFDLAFAYRTEIDDGDDDDKVSQAGLPDGYFDIIAGVRLQYLEQRVDLNTERSGPFRTVNVERDLGQDETWVEPLLSARFRYQISPKFAIGTRGDISGFGIDDLSTTWRILTGFDWVFSGDTSLKLGYEVYSIDYKTSDDQFGLDQFQHGPYIGVTFRF